MALKILSVVGARPQFVKAAAVSRALRRARGMREVLVHTGQHYDRNMSRIFFRELDIPEPDVNLGIGSGGHGAQTGRMLEALERVIARERPACVMVYGDTNSTLAGALAAAKLRVPIAHVEAGLRSYNRAMPEELNRVVADHAADLLFAPTRAAVANLRREGVPAGRIVLTGDVMYDAALYYAGKAGRASRVLDELDLRRNGYALATVHRAENTDDRARLLVLFEALRRLARDLPVVVPIHPRTRKALARAGWRGAGDLRLIEPVGYLDMVCLERGARLIATDSGGVQKEAYFYSVPCVTLRAETEWVELVATGWNTLVPPTSAGRVHRALRALVGGFRRPPRPRLYGNGRAADAVVRHLRRAMG